MYSVRKWVDRVTQFVNRFMESTNSDGSVTHQRVDGEVVLPRAQKTSTTWKKAFWRAACYWRSILA